MREHDEDVLRDIFAGYGSTVSGAASADRAEVTAIARRRRHVRIAVTAAAAVVALAVPVSVLAATVRPDHTPNPPAATPTASPSPSPSAEGPSRRAAPDGRISLKDLAHARIDLPAAPGATGVCFSGPLQMRGNPTRVPPGPTRVTIAGLVYADVDGDGAQETVARIDCAFERTDTLVVVFDRDAAGRIVTLGEVTRTSPDGPVVAVRDIRAGADGTVEVQVGDQYAANPYGGQVATGRWQWRAYRFDGLGFTQSGGPVSFPKPPPADLVVKAGPIVLGSVSRTDRRTGQTVVTVTSTGVFWPPAVRVRVWIRSTRPLPVPITVTHYAEATDTVTCASGDTPQPGTLTCVLGPSSGNQVLLFFIARGADDAVITTGTGPTPVEAVVRVDSVLPDGTVLADLAGADNEIVVPIHRRD
jgi:hypothetical protein